MSSSPTPPEPAPSAEPLATTPLRPFHLAHRAHLVPFAGWEMPLYYEGIIPEHLEVRRHLGLFDVSHMGILTVRGGHAAELLARRTTANVVNLAPGQVRYTFLLDATGAIVDDLLVSRLDTGAEPDRSFLVVPNAARAPAIFDLLREHRRPDTEVLRHNGHVAILAVQGPAARSTLEALFGWSLGELGVYHIARFPLDGDGPATGALDVAVPATLASGVLVSRTGYTGEAGYELFVSAERAVAMADRIVAAGARPCGLGSRDTLRLEKGYLLSGQDFHQDRSPLEAGQDRFVEFDHAFVGRDVLERQRREGVVARLAGIRLDAPGAIPRHGTPVLAEGKPIATATSGGLAPSLGCGIALAYLPPALGTPGTEVQLDLRGRLVAGRVVKLPFLAAAASRR